MRVLVVEDDPSLGATLRLGLGAEGFDVEVAASVEEAVTAAERGAFRLALVDVNLPDGSGFALCPRLKDRGMMVVMLTARSDVADRVHGFELGADDYIPKPFAFEELVARMRAVARRPGAEQLPVLSFSDVEVHLERQQALRAGHPLDLTRREYDLLCFFLRNPGRVVTREQILERVWGYDAEVSDGVLDVYISYLRRKLETFGPRIIQTVRGFGYTLRAAEAEDAKA
ncbi:MAG: response regulator transcription factor [Thermaerobacter sp.]|nr:response regulator transcription factor [Thermaerobacter sp.]